MRHSDGFPLHKLALAALIVTSTLVIIIATAWGIRYFATQHSASPNGHSTNPSDYAIGGFPLSGQLAPDFTLTDQFNQSVALSSLRGHEVVLAFIDARCKSLCPLTAQIMYNAKSQLTSSAASQIQLVAVNANPDATSLTEVQSWSITHGMLHQWLFLTGTSQQLEAIYHLYNVYDAIDSNGNSIHDPITFIIDATGHERLYFETLDSNSQADLKDEETGLKVGMQQWLPSPGA
jgi:cytochrome oxidase Cu insertion factor (SCO1/SenC/PrrC family)